MGMSEILTVKETAEQLKTTRQQIRKMIANGELPAVKVGREWRIPLASVREYFEENLSG
ncbi:helix-turn-helix domain-containing protein [Candidatus Agathobaculum pullicola]|uniref:helix-turn-helix domain-containing protein n=1 Tax=Candidatus Agathobaculum pullicola TaxID=2838426 RepID=UPI003F932BB9